MEGRNTSGGRNIRSFSIGDLRGREHQGRSASRGRGRSVASTTMETTGTTGVFSGLPNRPSDSYMSPTPSSQRRNIMQCGEISGGNMILIDRKEWDRKGKELDNLRKEVARLKIEAQMEKKDPSREATCSKSQSSSKVTVEIDKNELEIMKEELDKLRNFENHVQTLMLPDELMDRFKEQAKGNKMMYLELCLDRFEWNLANENYEKKSYNFNDFITESKYYLQQGNFIQTCEKLWGAFCASVAIFFEKFRIKITSHKARSYLIEIISSFHPQGGYIQLYADRAERIHANFYLGEKSKKQIKRDMDKLIDFEKLINEVNIDDVRKVLAPVFALKEEGSEGSETTVGDVTFRFKKQEGRIFGAGLYHFDYEAFVKYDD